MSDIKTGRKGGGISRPEVSWETLRAGTAFRCRVILVPQDGGRFAVHAATLPDISAQGDSVQEALENIRNAIKKVIVQSTQYGKPIRWSDTEVDYGPKAKSKWVIVRL